MTASDTIFALSSGVGRSAIGVIRISGPATSAALKSLAGDLPPARRFSVRMISHPFSGELLDEAVVVWLPGPNSFTGEDCGELHLHGSLATLSAVMQVLSEVRGVRPAEAGEFTRRAFLNGKMDLVEVEGLGDLLQARTVGQRRQALQQLTGKASSVFEIWREQLTLIRADIEATVDFVDEAGIAEAAAPMVEASIRRLLHNMQEEVRRSDGSEILRDGIRVVLAGHPNTGKSSLLNALASREAAIVSNVPGTTRDAIEVTLEIRGFPIILTDTAGLRTDPIDEVEREGIQRSLRHVSGADFVLWVWSADIERSETPDPLINPDLVVETKSDLRSERPAGPSYNEPVSRIRLSTRSGEGVPDLLNEIASMISTRYGNAESALLVSARQKAVVSQSIRHLNNALEVSSLEMKAEHIRYASDEIGRLTGRVDVEEWLGAIFSKFCIGK
jgi:tRNA modification GTPase